MKKHNITKFLKKALNYLGKIDVCIYIILIFCILGLFRNLFALRYFDFNFAYYNTKLFFAMFMLYLAQIGLILLRQRIVVLISFIQVLFCFFVYRDFTFLPIMSEIVIPFKNILTNTNQGSYKWTTSFGDGAGTLTSIIDNDINCAKYTITT